MWALIQSLLAKWAVFRLLLKTLGSLAWLVPVAFLLKAIGLPMLVLLGLLAVPVFLVLAIVGFPVMMIIILGVLMLVGFFALLSLGFAVLKIAIPIILIYWLARWFFRNGKKANGADPAAP